MVTRRQSARRRQNDNPEIHKAILSSGIDSHRYLMPSGPWGMSARTREDYFEHSAVSARVHELWAQYGPDIMAAWTDPHSRPAAWWHVLHGMRVPRDQRAALAAIAEKEGD